MRSQRSRIESQGAHILGLFFGPWGLTMRAGYLPGFSCKGAAMGGSGDLGRETEPPPHFHLAS